MQDLEIQQILKLTRDSLQDLKQTTKNQWQSLLLFSRKKVNGWRKRKIKAESSKMC